ncbi:MAG: SulP family inorganic anion transporter, partial [Lachnospiraceae bacterium]|nr:SulP family inorganic anion transporter [Lachnospiraceae bacterium]
QAMIVGLVCLAILIVWPKVTEKIPGSLVAVIVGIVMVKGLHMNVNTIGDLYSISNKLPSLHVPAMNMDTIIALAPDAFTIAVLAAIESLLSCVVADGMISDKHNSNTELIAQGVGNIGSALFGGIPATGAIARTAANIKSGGRSPVAGMVHSIVLVLVLVILMPYAALIPMPAIAAILFQVAYNMCQWRPFVRLVKTAPKSDIFVLVITFLLTVIFDLVVAIEVGMSDETEVRGWEYKGTADDKLDLMHVPEHVRVYEFNGPLFFGVADSIEEVVLKEFTECLILRMRSVNALDVTALNALEDLWEHCQKQNVRVIFSHVNEQPMKVMEKAGFAEKVGKENFCKHIHEAMERASRAEA